MCYVCSHYSNDCAEHCPYCSVECCSYNCFNYCNKYKTINGYYRLNICWDCKSHFCEEHMIFCEDCKKQFCGGYMRNDDEFVEFITQ